MQLLSNITQKNIIQTKRCDPENHIPTQPLRIIYHKPYKSERDLAEARIIIADLLKINAITKDQYNKLCIKFNLIPREPIGFTYE